MQQQDFSHQPVLLTEVLTQFAIKADGYYVDATFGRGGHSEAILEQLNSKGRILAIDQDWEAVGYAQSTFKDRRFTIMQGNFAELQTIVTELGWLNHVDGILFDLGVSSPQLDDAERGFSFMRDGPLDMRMNTEQGISAATWLAKISEKQLATALFEGGEERFSRRVAKAIVTARKGEKITRTKQLAQIIAAAIPKKQPGKHPATQSFQAIRIAVNREFDVLPSALKQAVACLKIGGRLCVISFHSIEDHIVKKIFREQSGQGIYPSNLPIRHAEIKASLKCIGRGIKPSMAEVANNVRSRSATLRVAEKIG